MLHGEHSVNACALQRDSHRRGTGTRHGRRALRIANVLQVRELHDLPSDLGVAESSTHTAASLTMLIWCSIWSTLNAVI